MISDGCFPLGTYQFEARRADLGAAHADHLLSKLDQLHELGDSIEAQQRQEPVVQRFDAGAVTATFAQLHTAVEQFHRFVRETH